MCGLSAFTGSRWLGLGGGGCQLVVSEGFLDALGAGGADALVDRQGLPQVRGGVAGVAVLQVAVAESFQGACFLGGGADVAGDGQRLSVLVAGLAGSRGPGREFAEAVQCFGLAEPVAAGRGTVRGPAGGWRRPPGSPRFLAGRGRGR